MSEQPPGPDFESIKQVNPYGMEYWSARELGRLLGYTEWRNFEVAIKRAKTSSRQVDQNPDDHFVDATKMVPLGSGSVRQVKDYILSRLACYLIAQNGDPRKPEIAAAQVYFATAARELELQKLRLEQEKRLLLRERVAEGNKDLAQAAYQAGVLSRNFGKFQNAGYEGLYGGLDLEAIKSKKGIEPDKDLLDHLGLAELGANALRIGLTTQKLKDDHVTGEAKATGTHRQVGREIRKAIKRVGGRMPEDLPAEPSIKPLLEERKRRRKKTLPDPSPPGARQGSLFDDPPTPE